MPKCDGENCGAEIMFVPTQASEGEKRIPLDVAPNQEGNVTLVWSESRKQREAVVHPKKGMRTLEEQFEDENDYYMPHHATCPDRERFAKDRG